MRIDNLYLVGEMFKNISPDSVQSGSPANLSVRSCPVRKLICPVRSSPTKQPRWFPYFFGQKFTKMATVTYVQDLRKLLESSWQLQSSFFVFSIHSSMYQYQQCFTAQSAWKQKWNLNLSKETFYQLPFFGAIFVKKCHLYPKIGVVLVRIG